jgi:hypothetical protein
VYIALPARISAAEMETHAVFVTGELGSDAIWNWR